MFFDNDVQEAFIAESDREVTGAFHVGSQGVSAGYLVISGEFQEDLQGFHGIQSTSHRDV